MNKYQRAFEVWRRRYLERELERAGGSVAHMAAYLGMNRQNAYLLLKKAGIRTNVREYRRTREGNAAWRALGDGVRAQ